PNRKRCSAATGRRLLMAMKRKVDEPRQILRRDLVLPLLRSRSAEDVTQAVIAFMTRVLEYLLRVVFRQVHRERPRPRPCMLVVERHRPLHESWRDWREPLDHSQLLARAAVVGLVRKVG